MNKVKLNAAIFHYVKTVKVTLAQKIWWQLSSSLLTKSYIKLSVRDYLEEINIFFEELESITINRNNQIIILLGKFILDSYLGLTKMNTNFCTAKWRLSGCCIDDLCILFFFIMRNPSYALAVFFIGAYLLIISAAGCLKVNWPNQLIHFLYDLLSAMSVSAFLSGLAWYLPQIKMLSHSWR